MTRKIVDTSATQRRIVDTSKTQRRIEPAEVAAALGAEPTGIEHEGGGSPLSHFIQRAGMFKQLQLQGSPANPGVAVPLSEPEWRQLEALAVSLTENGCTPSAGQVAGALLRLALHSATDTDPQRLKQQLQEYLASTAALGD